jgi:hypothetical protein
MGKMYVTVFEGVPLETVIFKCSPLSTFITQLRISAELDDDDENCQLRPLRARSSILTLSQTLLCLQILSPAPLRPALSFLYSKGFKKTRFFELISRDSFTQEVVGWGSAVPSRGYTVRVVFSPNIEGYVPVSSDFQIQEQPHPSPQPELIESVAVAAGICFWCAAIPTRSLPAASCDSPEWCVAERTHTPGPPAQGCPSRSRWPSPLALPCPRSPRTVADALLKNYTSKFENSLFSLSADEATRHDMEKAGIQAIEEAEVLARDGDNIFFHTKKFRVTTWPPNPKIGFEKKGAPMLITA